jgi:hypothetical protein
MKQSTIAERLPMPIRAGIFSSVEKAEEAVRSLQEAGSLMNR